ncbi:hypothetical protein DNTS_005182 [Danionella cerebrum]|uniref:Uncharacterized protein n=1 Tax=Danionella cerebrum TaxID=2873325 RepID=A0A553QUC9_9TELE|nr:hypothetical protein DNTS_005182 [Danionella translucida]
MSSFLSRAESLQVVFSFMVSVKAFPISGSPSQFPLREILSKNIESIVSQNSEILSKNIESISQNNEILSKNIESISQNNEILSKNIESISQNNEILSKNIESISQNSEILSKNIESISQNNEILSKNIESISQNNEILSKNIESISQNNEILSKNIKSISQNNEILSKNIESISQNNEILSKNIEHRGYQSFLSRGASPLSLDRNTFQCGFVLKIKEETELKVTSKTIDETLTSHQYSTDTRIWSLYTKSWRMESLFILISSEKATGPPAFSSARNTRSGAKASSALRGREGRGLWEQLGSRLPDPAPATSSSAGSSLQIAEASFCPLPEIPAQTQLFPARLHIMSPQKNGAFPPGTRFHQSPDVCFAARKEIKTFEPQTVIAEQSSQNISMTSGPRRLCHRLLFLVFLFFFIIIFVFATFYFMQSIGERHFQATQQLLNTPNRVSVIEVPPVPDGSAAAMALYIQSLSKAIVFLRDNDFDPRLDRMEQHVVCTHSVLLETGLWCRTETTESCEGAELLASLQTRNTPPLIDAVKQRKKKNTLSRSSTPTEDPIPILGFY